jgi:hypothetical protein
MWTYDKPDWPGMYYINRGDVVTEDTLENIRVFKKDGVLCDGDGMLISDYRSDIKFMRIDFDWFNKVGNR